MWRERDTETFSDEDVGLELRAVYLEDRLVGRDDDEEAERQSLWYWFACAIGYDHWFAYALTDTCEESDADASVSDQDTEMLKRLAVYFGDPWDEIMEGCPHCIAILHRDAMHAMPLAAYQNIQKRPLEEIEEIRKGVEWKRTIEHVKGLTGGLVISAN